MPDLVQSIELARLKLDTARHAGAHPLIQQPLRRALLTALEDYATALDRLGSPVPYGMRIEMQLYQNLGRRA
ncbi:hypothetical protein L2K70_17010 [Nocardioides KLBMP 9356]|uniref:DUF222 domain-containing protein n=1 Tax=Nocardioides potassii TaxID=2911371 RepID=A0ABS9HFI3_9ACTN|nr:hypothetical protein [Nocardioides potassii]MCF6379314.1 hypothetical protein [Nocardioides potassii]